MLIPPAVGTLETYFFHNRQLCLMPSALSWVELKFVVPFVVF